MLLPHAGGSTPSLTILLNSFARFCTRDVSFRVFRTSAVRPASSPDLPLFRPLIVFSTRSAVKYSLPSSSLSVWSPWCWGLIELYKCSPYAFQTAMSMICSCDFLSLIMFQKLFGFCCSSVSMSSSLFFWNILLFVRHNLRCCCLSFLCCALCLPPLSTFACMPTLRARHLAVYQGGRMPSFSAVALRLTLLFFATVTTSLCIWAATLLAAFFHTLLLPPKDSMSPSTSFANAPLGKITQLEGFYRAQVFRSAAKGSTLLPLYPGFLASLH